MTSQGISRTFPGFDHVYDVHDPFKRGHFVGRLAADVYDTHAMLRGELTPTAPVPLHWFMGRQVPADFIWPTTSGVRIVSERVISVLQSHSFTGWTTFPVEVMNRDGEVLEGYHGLAITGRCGPMQLDRSVEVPKQYPAGVFRVYRGAFFPEDSWDGTDLFMPRDGRLFVFAVERVGEAFRKEKISNVAFARADLIERPTRD